jgi:type VI secretion system secreted protein Hcp
MPIYMNWGNSVPPKIKGDVTAVGHVDWIELSSAQYGMGRNVTAPTGNSRQPSSGPTISEMVITKGNDSSSPSLFRESVNGEGTPVLIDFVKIEASPVIYLQLKLTNVLISRAVVSGGGGRATESLTLNFTKLEWGSGQGLTPHTSRGAAPFAGQAGYHSLNRPPPMQPGGSQGPFLAELHITPR